MSKIIVLDGLDGSGKNTQAKLLEDSLHKLGYKTKLFSFPAYDSKSSSLIKMYLSGEIDKDASNINPYAAAIFYTADRFIQFQTNLKQYLDTDTILIFDRYISANIIHQGSKIDNIKDKLTFFDWCYNFETEVLKLPKEDLTILLMVKPEVSSKLINERNRNKDIHEQNIEYLEKCYKNAEIAAKYNNWKSIDCNKDNNIREINDIHKELLNIVLKELEESKG